jgi:hypothetical protein
MALIDDYRAARVLISDRARWTTVTVARNKFGHACLSKDSGAVKFCALGALGNVMRERFDSGPLRLAAEKLGLGDPTFVNDGAGHEMVLRMFDLAIEDLCI